MWREGDNTRSLPSPQLSRDISTYFNLDMLGPLCIVEGIPRLLNRGAGRTNVGYHGGPVTTSQ